MTREYFIKNMLFSMQEYNVPLETALEQTWVAGYEYYRRYETHHNGNVQPITEFGRDNEKLGEFPSVAEASRVLKIPRKTLCSVLNGSVNRMRNGHYFEYSNKNRHQQEQTDDAPKE